MRRLGVVLATAFAVTGLGQLPALADDTVTVHGIYFPDQRAAQLTLVGCESLYARSTEFLQPYISRNTRLGTRSLKYDLAGGNAIGTLSYVDSMADTTVAGLQYDSDPGAQGVAYAGFQRKDADGYELWIGRASLVSAGGWQPVDATSLTYTWAEFDMQTSQPTGETATAPATVADFAEANGGDGAGFYMVGFGCDGSPFRMDGWRVGEPGSTTTYDLEGLHHPPDDERQCARDRRRRVGHAQRLGPGRGRPTAGARHDDPGGQARRSRELPAGAGGRRRGDRPERHRVAHEVDDLPLAVRRPAARHRQRVRAVPGRRGAAAGRARAAAGDADGPDRAHAHDSYGADRGVDNPAGHRGDRRAHTHFVTEHDLRVGGPDDAALVGRMLYDFNLEFDQTEPAAEQMAELAGPQLASGEVAVLFGPGDPPDGFAQLRFRLSLYDAGPDACLEELWVRPHARGTGLGQALLEGAMDLARKHGATRIDLNTSVTDEAARALYVKCGFTNEEFGPGGPSMLYYERDL